MELSTMSPKEVRALIRDGVITHQTSGMCGGYAQANLCILPKDYAFDFLLFCMRNPKPCPVLEVGDIGSRVIRTMADGGDICRDIPKYRIWRNGVLEREVTDISAFWQEDFVYFLIGCSFRLAVALAVAASCLKRISPFATLSRAGTCLCSTPISHSARRANFTATWSSPCARSPTSWWSRRST